MKTLILIASIVMVSLSGCATLPKTEALSAASFPEKGKVVYVTTMDTASKDYCSVINKTVAKCYPANPNDFAAMVKGYPSKEARKAAEATAATAVLKEISDAGAMAKVEEQAVLIKTSSTGGSIAGTGTFVAGAIVSGVSPSLGQGMMIGSQNIHDSDGVSQGYNVMRFIVTYKDGTKKRLQCTEDESQALYDVCRSKIHSVLQEVL